jgi:U-box domain
MSTVPSEFVCPITMEIMEYPMVTRHGQTFERSAIVAWLNQGSDECSLTRKPLRLGNLIFNSSLAQKIKHWRELHGIPSGTVQTIDRPHPTTEQYLRHIYGTSVAPFRAVTLAPEYYDTPPTCRSRTPGANRPGGTARNKRQVVCAPINNVRSKSAKALHFLRIKV